MRGRFVHKNQVLVSQTDINVTWWYTFTEVLRYLVFTSSSLGLSVYAQISHPSSLLEGQDTNVSL